MARRGARHPCRRGGLNSARRVQGLATDIDAPAARDEDWDGEERFPVLTTRRAKAAVRGFRTTLAAQRPLIRGLSR